MCGVKAPWLDMSLRMFKLYMVEFEIIQVHVLSNVPKQMFNFSQCLSQPPLLMDFPVMSSLSYATLNRSPSNRFHRAMDKRQAVLEQHEPPVSLPQSPLLF